MDVYCAATSMPPPPAALQISKRGTAAARGGASVQRAPAVGAKLLAYRGSSVQTL